MALARATDPRRRLRGRLKAVPATAPEPDEVTTQPLGPIAPPDLPPKSTIVRLFGSDDFFRLWLAQVVSALGDWIGFVAIVAIATRVGGDSPAAAVSLVMSARMIPGFFLAPVAGVLVDRWDRKKVMVACDIARAGVLCTLPFIDHVWTLVVASLALEVATLLWSPAKEASVPNLVPATHLATANSLSIIAAYGTFPIATLLFAFLAKVATWLGNIDSLDFLKIDQEMVAVYLDVLTFCLSAVLISTLALPHRAIRGVDGERMKFDFYATLRELREGWRFMFITPTVRAVMAGIGTGLLGGGMVVPLGDIFSRRVLGGGSAGFGLLLTGMGFGMAAGVLLVTTMQKRLPKARVFCWAVVLAGVAILCAASMSTLPLAVAFVALLGVCAGCVYVLGFTILHETVEDEMRGRIFSALYTLVRFCLLLSFTLGPILAETLGRLSSQLVDNEIAIGAWEIALPGERLALWLAGVVILGAGLLAFTSLRLGERRVAVDAE
jgi:dTMP kinase